MSYKKSNKFKLIFLFSTIFILFFVFTKKSSGVFDYNPKRDRENILNIFKSNWYWLVGSSDFSVEYTLDNRSSSKPNKNDLEIKVLYEKGNFIGFTAYFMLNANYGQILFIAIKEEYRGRGYSKKLINYAIKSLEKKGALKIYLVTRTENKPARALYTSSGFRQLSDDGTFVSYIKALK